MAIISKQICCQVLIKILANDVNLRVNIPSLQSAVKSSPTAGTSSQLANVNRTSYAEAARKPPIIVG